MEVVDHRLRLLDWSLLCAHGGRVTITTRRQIRLNRKNLETFNMPGPLACSPSAVDFKLHERLITA